jgi:hypothetical protein
MGIRSASLLALCSAACAAIAAGCGGSSTLSKQELASKADAICVDNRRVVAEELGSLPTTPAAIAAYDGGDLRIDPQFESRLGDLKPPKSVTSAYKGYLASRKASLDLTRREEAAARSGNPRALQAFTAQRQAGSQERARLAKQLGFKVCGVPADVPNLLGPSQPSGPPPASVKYPKPKDTLDDAIAKFKAVRTCSQLQALQNSDDTKVKPAECQQVLPGLQGLLVLAKDEIGPVGVVDINAANGHGTALFVEDGKSGKLTFSSVVGYEGGAVHKPAPGNDAARNAAGFVAAVRANDGAALHRYISENSSFYAMRSSTVSFPSPTGSGARLIKDVRADKSARPQLLGIGVLYGFFELKANGDNYVLITIRGPTGYRFIGFYPLPKG